MVTYDMTKADGPLYIYLYQCLKKDIQDCRLTPGTKLPSKRTLAGNLGISTITIENAYGQLESEGYIQTVPKKGYFISGSLRIAGTGRAEKRVSKTKEEPREDIYDISSNKADVNAFPFSVWSRLMRETLIERSSKLLKTSDRTGAAELREAISDHLSSFRGMDVDPDNIVIGAGTEYLYGILVNLLGRDKVFCVEDPGYSKPRRIYESNDVRCVSSTLDDKGIIVDRIREQKADIIHICPTHQFPTGITMPVSRRYELLAWASEKDGRYIIEDDYDSEFRLSGMPISPFLNIDAGGKVIYMNTFSKSLAPTMRISYMILPHHLMTKYREKLGFYSCPVPAFEQYTLAAFISRGYFEKHINRMRLYYGRKRKEVMDIIRDNLPSSKYELIENDSGLHFNLKLKTEMSDRDVKERLKGEGIGIQAVSDYNMGSAFQNGHVFMINYSSIDTAPLAGAVRAIGELLR